MNKREKLVFVVPVFFLFSTQIFAADGTTAGRKSRCCDLSTLAYKVASKIGRNDYLYLAHTNSIWFLKKKIEQKEDLRFLDVPYRRYGIRGKFNVAIWVFRTPLQEAVIRGNLEAVRILLAAGADRYKKSTSESYNCEDLFETRPLVISSPEMEAEHQRLCDENDIGRTAVGFSIKFFKTPCSYDLVSIDQRRAIYELLQENN